MEDEQPLLGAHQQLGQLDHPRQVGQVDGDVAAAGIGDGAAGDRLDDVEPVGGADSGRQVGPLLVDEQGDVLAQSPLLVEHPAAQARVVALQLAQHLAGAAAADLEPIAAGGEVAQGRGEMDDGHDGPPAEPPAWSPTMRQPPMYDISIRPARANSGVAAVRISE